MVPEVKVEQTVVSVIPKNSVNTYTIQSFQNNQIVVI
jgi:hypothetical protein